jgi:hypothetical protein
MKQVNNLNFLKRIKTIQELIKNDNSIILKHKNINPKEIDELKSTGCPSDIILILIELGEFTLSMNECLIINFWKPSTLQKSSEMETPSYCTLLYEVPNVAENLLFFAESARAEVFCYDTNFDPWKILVFDGLSLYDHNDKLIDFLKPENQCDNYFEDKEAIFVLEYVLP